MPPKSLKHLAPSLAVNLKITIAYDGTNYLGWQKTKEGPSIEEALQQALEQIFQFPVLLNGASRTDAGVHALGQTVNCLVPKARGTLKTLFRGLNALLPPEIRVLSLEEAPNSFHATVDCISKEYHYWICTGSIQLPHLRFTSWHYHYDLDLESMEKAAQVLVGTHDFKAFCNVKKNERYESTIRELRDVQVCGYPEKNRVQIILKGNRFLYKMARNIAGALAVTGKEKKSAEEIEKILEKGDRKQAPLTAPAHGLTLFKTFF